MAKISYANSRIRMSVLSSLSKLLFYSKEMRLSIKHDTL